MSSSAPLHVFQLSTLAEFRSLRRGWNQLAAGMPMRSWEWNAAWWQQYGNPKSSSRRHNDIARQPSPTSSNELYLLAVFDADERLVAVAPWYIETGASGVRTLKFLGSGEVCTDHATVLCQPGREADVARALARTLCDPLHLADWLPPGHVRHWDRIDWESIAADDMALNLLFEELECHGQILHRSRAASCWKTSLPENWEAFLQLLSRPHRKKIRWIDRNQLDSGRAVVRWVESADQFPTAWDILVRLHQARQQSLGHAGSFSSAAYARFHQNVADQLREQGRLWLGILEIDGQPAAAEYLLAGDRTLYAYQGGIDPQRLRESPGRIIMTATIKRAIERGFTEIDFLRGDEPYKATWRATPDAMRHVRVVPPTAANRVRHKLWVASDHMKHWLKRSPVAS